MSKKIVTHDVAIVYRGKKDQEPVLACNGVDLEVEGRVGTHRGYLCLLNPSYLLHGREVPPS